MRTVREPEDRPLPPAESFAPAWATPRLEQRPPSCVVCGALIGGEHSYLATLGDYDSTAHTECVDWSSRPFPFGGLVTVLVRCRRAAVGTNKGAWFLLSRRLWLIQKDWANGGAAAVRSIRAIEREARQLARLQNLAEKLLAML